MRITPNRKRVLDVISSDSVELDSSIDLYDKNSPFISNLFRDAGIVKPKTKGGWCLRQGMAHILTANCGALVPVVKQEGAPKIYDSVNCRHQDSEDLIQEYKPDNCFQSLCRIIAGQQLAGSAASTIWNRLLITTGNNLTPQVIIELAEKGLESNLQKPAGLSLAKAKSIKALSESFVSREEETLTESFLSNGSEAEVREALMKIKGIGPWSCDMFFIFSQECQDILPVTDLGVRNGIAKFFALKGKGKKGSLCQKKDLKLMKSVMQPYTPYRSIATYYMWKIADAKDMKIYGEDANTENIETTRTVTKPETPNKTLIKRSRRQVTP